MASPSPSFPSRRAEALAAPTARTTKEGGPRQISRTATGLGFVAHVCTPAYWTWTVDGRDTHAHTLGKLGGAVRYTAAPPSHVSSAAFLRR